MRVELIDFREPEDGQLYVTRIKWDKDSDQLYELLRERFSKFGLLHMVKVYRGGNDNFSCSFAQAEAVEGKKNWWCYYLFNRPKMLVVL